MCISIHTLDLVMVEAPLIAITALFFLGNDATALANLNMEYFSHSFLQILKSSVRLDGERRCTAIFSSFHWFSMGFKSGLWLGHSLSFIELSSNHSLVIIAVCLGTDLCGTVNRQPSRRSWAIWSRFSSLYNARFIFPTIKTRPPLPAAEIHPHNMMLPPPCFTVGMVICQVMSVASTAWFPPDVMLGIQAKNLYFGFIRPKNLVNQIWESFRCRLANFKWAVMCLLQRRDFCLVGNQASLIMTWQIPSPRWSMVVAASCYGGVFHRQEVGVLSG